MMVVIIVLTMVELFFIYFASSRLSRPVENVSRQLQAIESLNFDVPARPPSQYSGDRKAGIGGCAAANIAEIVLLVRSAGCGPPTHQVGHSADTWASSRDSSPCSFPIWRIFPATPKRSRLMTLLVQISTYLEEVSVRDLGGRRHRRQVHRRRRHGFLECPG